MQPFAELIPSKDPAAHRRPIACLIPGGPGLSAATLGETGVLGRNLDVVRVHPPGTGGRPELDRYSFAGVIDAIAPALKQLGRPLVLAGHSFGGFYAAALAERLLAQTAGWIGIASPLSLRSLGAIAEQAKKAATPAQTAAERAFGERPAQDTFRNYLAELGHLYFAPERQNEGRGMLQADECSPRCFTGVFGDVLSGPVTADLMKFLLGFAGPKLLIARAEDRVTPASLLKEDAQDVAAEFQVLAGWGHFIGWDDPGALARAILDFYGRAGF